MLFGFFISNINIKYMTFKYVEKKIKFSISMLDACLYLELTLAMNSKDLFRTYLGYEL